MVKSWRRTMCRRRPFRTGHESAGAVAVEWGREPGMRKHLIILAAVVAMVARPAAMRGQRVARSGAVPDISGVWLVDKFEPRLFPNGGAPFTARAEAKFKATDLKSNDPNLACLPLGLPRFMISV